MPEFCFQTQTNYDMVENTLLMNGTNVTMKDYTRVVGTAPGTNVLGMYQVVV